MTRDFAKKPSDTAKTSRAKSSPASKTSAKKPAKRKTNSRKKPPAPKRPSIWLWLLVGLLLTLFVAFLVKLSSSAPQPATSASAVKEAPVAEVDDQEQTSQVKFDFYEILREHEVEVDDEVIAATPKQDNIIYFLQVGSFKQAQDADSLRAKLILLDMPATVEKTINKEQQEWHRVVAGPFDTRSKLAKARSVLASERINSLLIKRKAQ